MHIHSCQITLSLGTRSSAFGPTLCLLSRPYPIACSHTHDVLTKFLQEHGWDVTPHYLLDTAWVAKFAHGKGGRTIGVNSEMDALPGIGHACGHNLIAIAGVAVACAIRAVLEEWDVSGNIILLGTPGMLPCARCTRPLIL